MVGISCGTNSDNCPDLGGCPSNQCPDFSIKKGDTYPFFKVSVSDCDGPLDLTDDDLSATASMWGKARLKTAINDTTTTLSFADNIGFTQIKAGDIIVMDRVRSPEKMLVVSFDETNYTITVDRGYSSTTAVSWAKGSKLKFFRFIDSDAALETVLEDIEQLDGTILKDQLMESRLVYDWVSGDTDSPGCFWMQFKLTNGTWIRSFPETSEGFLIKVYDSV
jgi:hypothetical protein